MVHDVKYSGCSTEEKLKKVKALLDVKKSNVAVLSSLDEIAWILNLRGNDIEYNPMFLSYLLIIFDAKTEIFLYSDPDKFKDETVQNYLKTLGVHLLPYLQIFADLKKMKGKAIGISLDSANAKLVQAIDIKENASVDIQDSIQVLKVLSLYLYSFS